MPTFEGISASLFVVTMFFWKGLLVPLLLFAIVPAADLLDKPYERWSLAEARQILNKSPWGQEETFTRVIGGIGSGLQGEKEIYNTFFVRLLSALPIRRAYARVKQIQLAYDELPPEERARLDGEIQRVLDLDVSHWIVVAVTFRSNNEEQQSRVEQFFQTQTLETLKNRAFLATRRFPRLELSAYFPPREESVGAKFVFPRSVAGVAVAEIDDEDVAFELDVPGAEPLLRSTFSVKQMISGGELIL